MFQCREEIFWEIPVFDVVTRLHVYSFYFVSVIKHQKKFLEKPPSMRTTPDVNIQTHGPFGLRDLSKWKLPSTEFEMLVSEW